MPRPRSCVLLLALLLAFPGALPAGAQPAPQAGAERPRLCVLVVVDQLIPEQLDRLGPWLSGGLARFAGDGQVFREAYLPYGVTETGPGHVTLATGRLPSEHGVIANAWIDPESGRPVYCVEDPGARHVRDSGPVEQSGSRSWRNARSPALGDYLAGAAPGSRVVSLAGKDRSAVGLAGAVAELVLWWDSRSGGFQSSSAYLDELPGWVVDWNGGWVERVPRVWEPLATADLAGSGSAPDEREGERERDARRSFPYPLPIPRAPEEADDPTERERETAQLAARIPYTPFQDDLVLDLAACAVRELELGAAGRLDLLALGLSACDYVGHSNGPYSREVTDLLLRLDRSLGRLFEVLDEEVGADSWIAVLSADHGVLELPEELQARGIGARRISGRENGRALAAVAGALEEQLGVAGCTLQQRAGGLYLSRGPLRDAGVELAAANAVARDALLAAAPFVARAWTREEAMAAARDGTADIDPWFKLALASYDPERGPDVLYQLQPWHVLGSTGTNHGSPYPYDRRVPLIFYGPGRAASTSHDPATILDVLPTLLTWLGLEVPAELAGEVR